MNILDIFNIFLGLVNLSLYEAPLPRTIFGVFPLVIGILGVLTE